MRKLVAAGMHAQLQIVGQPVALHGVGDHGQVAREFLFELLDVAHVIHAFVEAAGEFGRDGLDGNSFIGDGRQNQQQLGRRLRRIGFVHGNFGDEAAVRPSVRRYGGRSRRPRLTAGRYLAAA